MSIDFFKSNSNVSNLNPCTWQNIPPFQYFLYSHFNVISFPIIFHIRWSNYSHLTICTLLEIYTLQVSCKTGNGSRNYANGKVVKADVFHCYYEIQRVLSLRTTSIKPKHAVWNTSLLRRNLSDKECNVKFRCEKNYTLASVQRGARSTP